MTKTYRCGKCGRQKVILAASAAHMAPPAGWERRPALEVPDRGTYHDMLFYCEQCVRFLDAAGKP